MPNTNNPKNPNNRNQKKTNNSSRPPNQNRRVPTKSYDNQNTRYTVTKNNINQSKKLTNVNTSKKITKQSNTTKKKYNTFNRAIWILFIIFFVYGLGMIFSLMRNTDVDSMVLKSIDITKNDTYKGIIIRDEQVYTSSTDGYLNLVAKDTDKIKKGSLIFSIENEISDSLSSELTQVEDDIFNLQTFREEYSNYRTDIDLIQSNIEKSIDNYSYDSYSDINDITEQVNDQLELRKQLVFADQRISDTSQTDTKEIIEGKIDENATNYYAQEGGIVSYNYDGLESTITPETMELLTPEQTKMDSTYKKHDKLETVADEAILRIIESNTWYIGTYIDKSDASSLSVGDSQNLFLNVDGSFVEVPARVYYLSENTDNSVYVIFELHSYMQDFMNQRSVDVALKELTYMNMKIPKTAIAYKYYLKIPISFVRETDQKVIIKQLDDGTTATIPITVEGTDETNQYYYIDKDENDVLVGSTLIDPDDATNQYLVPEVIETPGVYKINNGVASFEKININKDIEEENIDSDYEYIIPTSTLKEYDRILIHSDSAVEGSIIN